MSSVLLREPISERELIQIKNEFPSSQFFEEKADSPLPEEKWKDIEIFFGNTLSEKELQAARRLRWIHCPTPYTSSLLLDKLIKVPDLLVTNTKGENLVQTGEFLEATLLYFAKQLHFWSRGEAAAAGDPWKIKGKTLLQIGLGLVGSEMARRGQQLGMRTWGAQKSPSFHPHCQRVYPLNDLSTLLRAADVVCISLPRGRRYRPWLCAHELESLKEDSILLVTGAPGTVDFEALGQIIEKKALRGVLIDTLKEPNLPKNSPLLSAPNVLITPNIASYPREPQHLAFRTFRFNMRQFTHGNYIEMKNQVNLEEE